MSSKGGKKNQPKNEVRVVRGDGRVGRYLKYINGLFTEGEKPFTSVTIKGAGHAIPSVLKLAELIKRKIKGIHQMNSLSHFTVTDTDREGYEREKRLVLLTVTFDKKIPDNTEAAGYQEPLPEDQITEFVDITYEGEDDKAEEGEEGHSKRGKGRGRGRGRGGRGRGRGGRGRGRGRGGYYQPYYQQQDYNQDAYYPQEGTEQAATYDQNYYDTQYQEGYYQDYSQQQ